MPDECRNSRGTFGTRCKVTGGYRGMQGNASAT